MDVNEHRRGVIKKAKEKGWAMKPGPGLAVTVMEPGNPDTPMSENLVQDVRQVPYSRPRQ